MRWSSSLTRIMVVSVAGLVFQIAHVSAQSEEQKAERTETPQTTSLEHELRDICGWQVFVDHQLLNGPGAATGEVALKLLEAKLFEIKLRLPESRVQQLQQVKIWLDFEHPLKSMQYHPNAGWLTNHGYDPALEKCVHIPRAQGFIDNIARHAQPSVVLHELAHAYHDQFLSWDHSGIMAAYEQFRTRDEYESILHISGTRRRHYALTNHKEFFAEMSEAFLGTNDFYPFVRGELKEALPELDTLLHKIWLHEDR